MIAGHPLEMPSRIMLPSAKPSCVSVSFTSLPCGSSTKVTCDGRSFGCLVQDVVEGVGKPPRPIGFEDLADVGVVPLHQRER